MYNSLQSRGLYSPWNSLDQNTGVGSLLLLQEIFPTQGWNSGLTQCRQILYPLSHKGKSKNTGVGSSSLLQWIFLTQKLNQGLLHCRWILYQLNYQGSPAGKPQLQLKYSLSSQFRYKTSSSIWELRSFQTQKSSTYSWTQLNFSNCILSLTLCPQDMWLFWLWMRKRLFPSHLNEAWACWLYHPQISQ